MEWGLQDNGGRNGAWVPPDCGVSELVIKGQQRRSADAHRVLYECQRKQCQIPPLFNPPPLDIFIKLVPIQAEKVLGSSIGCIYSISKLNIAVSDMSDSLVSLSAG